MTDKYQVVPPLSDEAYAHLKRDISEKGVLVPVEYDEDGNILDGHHRVRACRELGVTEWPRVVREGMTEDEKRAHARCLNLVRRQLTRKQKQELIREQLKETPEKPDLQIAKELGVSDKTVTTQRTGMVRRSEIPNVEKSTDTLGRKQPRHHHRKDTENANSQFAQTGETSQPPAPKKGPSEKSIEKAVEIISTTAVAVLIDLLKKGTVLPAVAKRVAQLSEIEQHFFVDCAQRGPDCLDSPKKADEFRAMGRVVYDRQGYRHVPEQHPLQKEEFDLERDFQLLIEAEAILSRITTPPDILRFARRNPELLPQDVKAQITKLTTQDRMRHLRVNV